MSRPKYYWYGNVKRMVMKHDLLERDKTQMAKKYCKAIEKALDDISKLENGEDRIKAIRMVYLDKSHTVSGASLEMHYCERTINGWLNAFIRSVGKNVGF